jgi:hypothetical protein
MPSVPNAERYRHIATSEIVKLFDQGKSHRQIGKLLGMGPCAVGTRLRQEGKVRPAPAVTFPRLKEARLDPAYEARHGIENRVICRQCGELKSEINANGNHSHLRTHQMTAEDYQRKFPGARLGSFARSAHQNRRQGGTKTIQVLMAEFAAMYLTPTELKECRRDCEWEERHGITEFVACRLCGLKSRSDLFLHLKRHGLTSAAYRERYPKSLQLPLGLHDAKNALARKYGREKRALAALGKAASRPADWSKKTIEYRIIATELLSSEGYMSNEELGERLDASRILRCPYAETWKIALTSSAGAAVQLVYKVRKWVSRPGRTPAEK